jgi:hypothetical protein
MGVGRAAPASVRRVSEIRVPMRTQRNAAHLRILVLAALLHWVMSVFEGDSVGICGSVCRRSGLGCDARPLRRVAAAFTELAHII